LHVLDISRPVFPFPSVRIMSDLRLGAVNLDAKDIAYIRALVRLFSHTEKLGWAFAEHPPYHAVVASRTEREANPTFFQRFQGRVLTLVEPPGMPEKDTVAYPIHANQFRDWLKARQAELLSALYSEKTPLTRAERLERRKTARAEDGPGNPRLAVLGARRFKLRRWPAASLLQGNPLHLRIATLMSRNALSVPQLVGLSGQSDAACRRVVAIFHDEGLLVEIVALDSAPATTGEPLSTAAPGAEDAAPVRRGLMASLRRRLGL
jgi:hypothetical protein